MAFIAVLPALEWQSYPKYLAASNEFRQNILSRSNFDTWFRMAGDSQTLAEIVTERLRADIIVGTLKPSQKLHLRTLKARYGFGGSPIREALSRLESEGLVISASQRGFWVAPTSREDLRDIITFRQVVEGAALQMSIERGDEAWELEVITCFHRLQKLAKQLLERPPGWADEWEVRHKAFHMALIAACGSPRMLEQCAKLYDETQRYRRLFLGYYFIVDEVIEEHRRLMQVTVERRIGEARAAHGAHLALTPDLNEALLVPAGEMPPAGDG
jgi:GntR family carbon starvation induced transcriptional regulator